ncbi:MAG TPA: hypothetical protein VF898_02400 [Chloroflexota bacterium]
MKNLFRTETGNPLSMLFARLQTLAPQARTVLIASIRLEVPPRAIVGALAQQAEHAQQPFRILALKDDAGPHSNRPANSEKEPELIAAGSVDGVREALNAFNGWTFVQGGSLLTSPSTLRAAAACDGTLIVVARRRDMRSDVEEASSEIRRTGGAILGVVFAV